MAAFLSEPPQVLAEKGFWKYRRCNCDGGTDKYKNGMGLEVWIVKANTIALKRSGTTIVRTDINNLTTQLNEILNTSTPS